MVHSLCIIGPHHTTGEGGVGDSDPDAVSTGGQHDVHRRRDVVRGPAWRLPGGPPERAGLGVRPRRRRLLPATAWRAVLPAQHAPHPRLLRLQHLLPAEWQLRHRLQLRRHRRPRQAGPKLWVMQVPGIRDFCSCFVGDAGKGVDGHGRCVSDHDASADSLEILVYVMYTWSDEALDAYKCDVSKKSVLVVS